MSRRRRQSFLLGISLGFCLAVPAAGWAETPAQRGYVDPAELSVLVPSFGSAPVAGSPEDLADKAASARYRSLEGSERWMLATTQAEVRPPMGLSLFDCALGYRLDAAAAPALARLYVKLLHDANGLAEQIKSQSPRPRPVGEDPERPACERLTEAGRKSNSYPSGSAALATAFGEALAQLAPERAEAVRETARQIVLSRAICGMHYPSDVAVGEQVGKAAFALSSATSAYAEDAAEARLELDAARQKGQTSPACAAERSVLAVPLP